METKSKPENMAQQETSSRREERLVMPLNLWLQWNGDGTPDDEGDVCENEVTWSREKIFNHDAKYILEASAKAEIAQLKVLIAEIIESECCTTDYFPEWEARARRLTGMVDSVNPGVFVRGDAEYCAQCGGYIRLICDSFGHSKCAECSSPHNAESIRAASKL